MFERVRTVRKTKTYRVEKIFNPRTYINTQENRLFLIYTHGQRPAEPRPCFPLPRRLLLCLPWWRKKGEKEKTLFYSIFPSGVLGNRAAWYSQLWSSNLRSATSSPRPQPQPYKYSRPCHPYRFRRTRSPLHLTHRRSLIVTLPPPAPSAICVREGQNFV